MCTFTITSPMQLGGVAYHVGTHEAELKRDWFVDEMERVGMLTIIEGEAPRDANEVIIEAEQIQSSDREALKAEAASLELSFPPNVKNEKLAQMIADKKAEQIPAE